MTTAVFDQTLHRIEMQLEDGLFTRGAQMTVEVGGERVVDIAIGDNGVGEAMSPEHVFRVYCTIKPVTVLAIASLLERGEVTLDEPLSARLPQSPMLEGGVTLRHVLTHTAGLHRPMGIEMEMLTTAKREQALQKARRPSDWRLGVDAAYSEYVGWHVLGWLLEAVSGQPLREYLRDTVLAPRGLDSTWIGMSRDEYRAVLPRLGVNADMRNLGGFPMLFERSSRVCTETNPAHGGYTNARDLARFYSSLLATLDERDEAAGLAPSTATLWAFVTPQRPRVYDKVLDRDCTFGFGFMTDLHEHAFGDRCSDASFGHSGNVGASFAFADPERDLAVGVVFNGLVGHEAAFLRRRALINALYADLDAIDETRAAAEAAAEPARGRSRFSLRRRRD
jgi:CubicO group peptidase (beta-lactamase class C family)